MRAEAGEQRQLLAAHEHVDGVDLDDADTVEDLAQVAPIDAAGGPAVGQALGGDRHAGGPRAAESSITTGRPAEVAEVLDGGEEAAGVIVGDVHGQGQVPARGEVEAGGEGVVEEQLAPPAVGAGEVGGRTDRAGDRVDVEDRAPSGDAEPQPRRVEASLETGPQAVTALVDGGQCGGVDDGVADGGPDRHREGVVVERPAMGEPTAVAGS